MLFSPCRGCLGKDGKGIFMYEMYFPNVGKSFSDVRNAFPNVRKSFSDFRIKETLVVGRVLFRCYL